MDFPKYVHAVTICWLQTGALSSDVDLRTCAQSNNEDFEIKTVYIELES